MEEVGRSEMFGNPTQKNKPLVEFLISFGMEMEFCCPLLSVVIEES